MNKSTAVDYYATQAVVARELGISDQAVSQWDDNLIPKWAALALEKITSGELKCDLSLYKGKPRKSKGNSSDSHNH